MPELEPAWRLATTGALLALLTLVSLCPGVPRPDNSLLVRAYLNTPRELQKVMHFSLYAVLTVMLLWSLADLQPMLLRYAVAVLVAVSFAAAMQWCQTRVPGRYGTLGDVALDAAGSALGALVGAQLL